VRVTSKGTDDDEWMDCPLPRPTTDSGTESFVTYRTDFPRLEIVPPS
jgi:hypothetical protein